MKTFLFILMGIIICDILFIGLPKTNKPVTEEEYTEFKEYMKNEGHYTRGRVRNETPSNN